MPSFKIPTQSQIDIAVQRMRSPEFEAYFFARLENPKWLSPLKENGLFAGPPSVMAGETGGTTFPYWPASTYLARMAKHAPAQVAEIFAEIRTDNVWVTSDLIEATLAMRAPVASTLVPAIAQAVRGRHAIHLRNAADVCVLLAEGEEVSAALTLVDSLFAPQLDERDRHTWSHDEDWHTNAMKKVMLPLVSAVPTRFLRRLCDWLEASVESRDSSNSGSDYSYVWRPSIDEHVENLDFDFASSLVGFLRDGIEEAVRTGTLSCHEVLDILEDYRYLVFRRIRIHVIKEFCDADVELIRSVLMDPDLFGDYRYIHEYAGLAGRRFDLLTRQERDTWFEWVEAGPPHMPDSDELDEKAREQARDSRQRYWKFKRLHWVRAYLEGDRRTFYERMLAVHGEPELADMNVGGGGVASGSGYVSPMTIRDLSKLSFEEAIAMVSAWKPEEASGFPAPDVEGLAFTFEEYVGGNPETFSKQADVLIGRPAIYIRSFIAQMVKALEDRHNIDVPSVLVLCQWVLEQPIHENNTPHHNSWDLVDKDWQWTRSEIAKFIEIICKAEDNGGSRYSLEDLRKPIWALLSVLCRDPAESSIASDLPEDDPRTNSYLTRGLNSPRGKAIAAGLAYARWAADHIKRPRDGHDVVPGGLGAMPEVREMLEWQISTGNRSHEALAILGLRIPLIYWIDKEWLKENTDQIFCLPGIAESPPSTHGWAAWNTFLMWTKPHREFLSLFKDQFAYAVEESTSVNLNEESRDQPMNRLGEHLMILYARGDLQLDNDLLIRFLDDTKPEIRRSTIGFVGRILQQDADVSEKVITRFKKLWEVYWKGNGKKDASQNPDSWLFGSWFSSGRFPASWSLDQLESFTTVVPLPHPVHAVAKRLEELTPTDVVRAARILDKMIRGDREGWHVHGWLDAARQTLMLAIEKGGAAREQAERTIDYLGRRGHISFGELLESESPRQA